MEKPAFRFLGKNKVFWVSFPVAAILSVILLSGSSPHSREPIAFNHSKHVTVGMECADCHSGVLEQSRATLPKIDTCLGCHQDAVTESPEEAKIRQFASAGAALNWQLSARLPSHIYFSHRRHVALGRLECAQCHGDVSKSTAPSNVPAFKFSMDRCMDCHAKQQVRSDCNDCHR